MLNNGGFLQPCNSQNCLATASGGAPSLSTYFVNKPHNFLFPKSSSFSVHALRCKTDSFSLYSQQFRKTHLVFGAFSGERCSGFCVFAQKKGSKGSTREVEVEDFEDDEEGFDDFDDFDDGEDEEDDEDVGVLLPIEKMKKWLERKPTGFGEGKAYDTSVEEKLLEELEKSRQAEAVNIENLKNNPVNPNSKKGDKKKKEPEVVPAGFRVRMANLPKKKNIHRDLELAFKGVPGIINITPAVSGTKKTRDPVCKGYGFIYFKSEQDASRFIQIFSKQTIAFGKVQKQVKYEMMNSGSSNSALKMSSDANNFTPQRLPVLDKTQDTSINMDESSWNKTSDEANKPDDELVAEQVQDIEDENLIVAELEDIEDDDIIAAARDDSEDDELVTAEMEDTKYDELVMAEVEDTEDDEFPTAKMEGIKDDGMEPRAKSPANYSSSLKQLVKLKATKKRLIFKGRGEKVPKVEDISENSSRGDGMETSTDDEQQIKLLEQRLLARLKGEKLPKLEIAGSDKWLKIKEEVVQSNVSKQQEKSKSMEKKQKPKAKAKGGKPRKFMTPVSAKRLRIREKAVLTDVFTKYGPKGVVASKEGS